jgi:hypothetical protein
MKSGYSKKQNSQHKKKMEKEHAAKNQGNLAPCARPILHQRITVAPYAGLYHFIVPMREKKIKGRIKIRYIKNKYNIYI